jgi:hypothetical protein
MHAVFNKAHLEGGVFYSRNFLQHWPSRLEFVQVASTSDTVIVMIDVSHCQNYSGAYLIKYKRLVNYRQLQKDEAVTNNTSV